MCIGIRVWWAPCRRPGGLGSGQEEDWRHIFLSELPEFFSLLLFNGSLTTVQRCTHQNCSTQYLFFFQSEPALGTSTQIKKQETEHSRASGASFFRSAYCLWDSSTLLSVSTLCSFSALWYSPRCVPHGCLFTQQLVDTWVGASFFFFFPNYE